jgi:glycosyltransferase involved in cell wall biosynthesis
MSHGASISAVIPAFNSAKYIEEALSSVFAQTRVPEQIIIVDDGSTDNTQKILEPYLGRIQYLYQENHGEAAARNTGIRHASGNFIAFLDADDIWLPEKLELQMDYFGRNPQCGLVYTDMAIFDHSGVVHESVKEWLGMSLPVGRVFPQLFWETLFGSGTVVCRRECFERIGFFDESFPLGCDYEMWLRLARRFEFGCVDQPLLRYRQHSAQATRMCASPIANGVPWEARAVRRILDLYPEIVMELGRTRVRHRLAKPYFYLACGALQSGEHKRARALLKHAILGWPSNLRYLTLYLASFLTPDQLLRTRALYHRISGLYDGCKRTGVPTRFCTQESLRSGTSAQGVKERRSLAP